MKFNYKRALFFIFIFIFYLTLIYALDESQLELNNRLVAEANNIYQNASLTNDEELKIPSSLDMGYKLMFGLEQDSIITAKSLIINICLFIIMTMFFSMLFSVSTNISTFTALIAGIALTALASVSGGFMYFNYILLFLSELFNFGMKNEFVGMLVTIALLIIFISLFNVLINKFKKEQEKEDNFEAGLKLALKSGSK